MINDIAFKWAAIKAERPIMSRQNELWIFDNMTTSTDIDKSVNDLYVYDYELVKFRFLVTKLKKNWRSELKVKSKCFLTKMWIRRRVSVNGKAQ